MPAERTSMRQESVQCTGGSHLVTVKERGVGILGTDKIVAAIVSRSNDHIVLGQKFESLREYGSRQMGSVAVEGNDGPAATLRDIRTGAVSANSSNDAPMQAA